MLGAPFGADEVVYFTDEIGPDLTVLVNLRRTKWN
jgi:hypothetical protein